MPRYFILILQQFLLLIWVGTISAESFETYRSEDAGLTWRSSGASLPRAARVNGFGSSGTAALAATDHGVFISLDEGRNWRSSGNTNLVSARPLTLISSQGTVFLGTERAGLLESRDNGESWRPITSGLGTRTIRSLLAVDDILFAGTDQEGVFRSTDGTNWMEFSEGLPAQAQVHQMANSGETIFAALYHDGLYRRTRMDASWRKMGSVTPLVLTTLGRALLVGHNPGGLQLSHDGGAQWIDVGSGSEFDTGGFNLGRAEPGALAKDAPLWALASNTHHAFAGAVDGIFHSSDEGRTWVRAVTGLPLHSPAVAFLANDRFVLATIAVKE